MIGEHSQITFLRVWQSVVLAACFVVHLQGDTIWTQTDINLLSQKQERASHLGLIWDVAPISEAIREFEQTGARWIRLGNNERAAYCLNSAAQLALNLSNRDHAANLLEQSLRLSKNNRLTDEMIVAFSLKSLLADDAAERTRADQFSSNAIMISRSAQSARAMTYALLSRGTYELHFGKIRSSIANLEAAQIEAQKTDDIALKITALISAGHCHLNDGNPNRARELIQSALQQSTELHFTKGIAQSYIGLANISFFLNERQTSLDFFKHAKELFPSNLEWKEQARMLSFTGQIYFDLGELDLAESAFRQAGSYFDRVDYRIGRILSLLSLGEVLLAKSDTVNARQVYQLAAKLSKEVGRNLNFALVNEGLGNIDLIEDKFADAILNYRAAERIYRQIGANLTPIQQLLGTAYERMGDFNAARQYFLLALTSNRRTKDATRLAENLFSLAKLDAEAGETASALSRITESLEITESLYVDMANSSFRRSYLSSIYSRYQLRVHLLMERNKSEPENHYDVDAFRAAEGSRSRSLLATLLFSDSRMTDDADTQEVEKEKEIRALLNLKKSNLTDLLLRDGASQEIELMEEGIRADQLQLDEAITDLRRGSPFYSAFNAADTFNLDDLQNQLAGKNTLLLEFSLGDKDSYLWTIDQAEVASFVLPAGQKIDVRVERLRKLWKAREYQNGEAVEDFQMRVAEADREYAIEARVFSEELLGQVAEKLKGKRLIIVADGRLQYFPVGALPMPGSGSDDPILLTNEVVYSPSASALKLFKTENPSEIRPDKDLLVFADPVFSKNDDRLTGLDMANSGFVSTILGNFRSVKSLDELPRLPDSDEEAKAISRAVGGFRSSVRSGFSANRESVLNGDIADYKILHFATHGLIDEKRPELSGILLSLYDQNGQQNDGGFIRLQDVYGLNLRSDLVVLSACDTGIGKEVRGEGVMSLTNAFLQAGSKTVVSSLWKVDDTATKALMAEFYRGMASDNLTVAASLRQAQIKLYNDPRFHSPFYWAAFTMQGDYDRVPQISTRYTKWTYLAAGLCFVLLAIWLFRARRSLKRAGSRMANH